MTTRRTADEIVDWIFNLPGMFRVLVIPPFVAFSLIYVGARWLVMPANKFHEWWNT